MSLDVASHLSAAACAPGYVWVCRSIDRHSARTAIQCKAKNGTDIIRTVTVLTDRQK